MPPMARGRGGQLRPAVLHFVVYGRLPLPGSPRDGLVEAFELRHTRLGRAEYLDELRGIWLRHRAQILEAAAGGEPWVARVLANPAHLDEDEHDEENDDAADGGER